ncbi:MAG: sulfatase-like hydrolase/transferase [Sedimentisphaerales bacterium]|nr:sulfatase-like hydrolase/transferase [Sedimentisphaerales bacterium]
MISNRINRRQFLKSTVFSAAALTMPGCSAGSGFTKAGNQKPNFLFILADDYGWSQLGCYGSKYYETPYIDSLAAQGMKFTDAYAACPVCSPTRASIMTGKYPARLHLTDFIAGGKFPYDKYKQPDWQKFLPLEEITIAEVLKTAGYTTASFGKWHLSIDKKPPKSLPCNPDKQGFDEYFVTYKPSSKDDPESDAHNVEIITEKSLEFLRNNKDNPFFLYVSHNTIHAPILAKKKLLEKYKNKPGANLPQNNPIVAAMIEELDNSVGSLLAKLDELDIADNTIVVFFGDNGGLEKSAKQTPLRSGKANLYEGGIREPLIVRWPGVVRQAGTCSEPVTSVDFFPTFLDILNLNNKIPKSIDGISLLPLLRQTGTLNREAIYWHYPHYHSSSIGPGGAVRMGDYKLLEWFDETISGPSNRFELYNLKLDISEQNDLSKKMPGKTEQLRNLLAKWRKKVGAQMMMPNPDYDPKKPKNQNLDFSTGKC